MPTPDHSQEIERGLKIADSKVELITLHHSLYYCAEADWLPILTNLGRFVMAPQSALHAVLMANRSDDRSTTTWLYNHFADKFFSHTNDQDLGKLAGELTSHPLFQDSEVLFKTNRVRFRAPDFEKLMAVVWMVLLYPDVHNFTAEQRREITEFVYDNFWTRDQPLIQMQDHLVINQGLQIKGLI